MASPEHDGSSTRDKILLAAMELLGESAGAGLSVRAVASRAGVSTGSLRHHFPTQRALQDEVLIRLYDLVASGDAIHDRSRPARDRLVDCLREVIAPIGVGEHAREALRKVVDEFIASEPSDDARGTYSAVVREVQRRVEYWLTVLADEGALVDGDNAQRARFLLTVLNGLSFERALPAEDSLLQTETTTLYMAADCVLGAPVP